MKKTKNAFAFRDFDSSHILQRPFFKGFYFAPDKSDAEILQSLNMATKDSVDILERRLYEIKAILERLTAFRQLINRHNENRLDKYNKIKSISQNVKITELQRPDLVMEYSSAYRSISELINKFKILYRDIDKKIQACYRKKFAARLKQIRKDLGLTQRQIGEFINISPQGVYFYERGERDLSISMIIRLAKALNMSTDQLLGVK